MSKGLTVQNISATQAPLRLPEKKKSVDASSEKTTPEQKPLVDKMDKDLAASNIVLLFMDTALRYGSYSPDMKQVIAISYIGIRILNFVYSMYSIPWKSTTMAEKIVLMNPAIYLASLISPEFNTMRQAALTCGVARRSLPKLVQSVKEVTKRPFSAIGSTLLHALNLITPGYFTYHAYKEIPSSSRNSSKPSCSDKSASEFAQMEPLTRFTSPELNPTCPTDAANALGVQIDLTCETAAAKAENECGTAGTAKMKDTPECQNVFEKVKTACETTCKTIQRTWRKLAPKVHPDSYQGNPKATSAAQTLNGCRDTLYARYQCRA